MKSFIKTRLPPKRSSVLYLIVVLIAALVFAAILENLVTLDPLRKIDLRFSAWLHDHQVNSLTMFMLLITRLHSLLGVTVMTLAVCVYVWIKRRRVWIVTLTLAVFGGMALNLLLKHVFVRARPHFDNPLLALTTYSFPSGHTVMATVFYGTLCAMVVTCNRRWLWRALAIAVAGLLILLVGFSRIYLGVHYLSDVLAAIGEGLAWLAFCLILVAELGRWQKKKQEN